VSIKKSHLEQKWYYRIAKVLVLTLPLAVIAIAYFTGDITVGDLSEKAVALAIGLPAYYLVVAAGWKIFLYIAFGGLEDDTKKGIIEPKTAQTIIQPAPAASRIRRGTTGEWIFALVLIAAVVLISIFVIAIEETSTGSPSSGGGGGGGSTCTPTGCGNLWRCTGSGSDYGGYPVAVDACFNSSPPPYDIWSGTCRQCP